MSAPLILIDTINDREAAALWQDGTLQDLIIDPHEDDTTPRPGAIYRARVGRPLKGLHGAMVDLPDGQTGFLREAKGTTPGDMILVQVMTFAGPGKAPPVSRRILFKSRFAIITPDRPGINIARSIRNDETRDRIHAIAHDAMAGADPALGLIIRSAASAASDDVIAEDIAATLGLGIAVLADAEDRPALLVDAPDAAELAWRDWPVEAEVIDAPDAFETKDIWGAIEDLKTRRFDLGNGAWMQVDPTAALTAIDVNTGADFSPAAAANANRAAIRTLPRALRLLGLGGVITIDFAPMSKKDRREAEAMLTAAFRADPIETSLAGWTPLGHFEAERKRERRPLGRL